MDLKKRVGAEENTYNEDYKVPDNHEYDYYEPVPTRSFYATTPVSTQRPMYYGEQEEFNRPYDRYAKVQTKGEQLKETAKSVASTVANNISNAVSTGIDYVKGKEGSNRGKSKLDSNRTPSETIVFKGEQAPLLDNSNIILIPEERIQDSLTHEKLDFEKKPKSSKKKKSKHEKVLIEEALKTPKITEITIEKKKDIEGNLLSPQFSSVEIKTPKSTVDFLKTPKSSVDFLKTPQMKSTADILQSTTILPVELSKTD